jgi:hypothetical protein
MLKQAKLVFGNLFLAVLTASLFAGATVATAEDSTWVQLFNGKDLTDWDIKFAGHPLNENYNNTFKVVDGILNVDYTSWTSFGSAFGHAINKTRTYSYYLIRSEYQIVGNKQVAGAGSENAWAIENNGLMLHSQSMASMTTNQDFPISMEAQLLGADNGAKNTMNLCTPGTGFYTTPTGGQINTAHCITSTGTNRPAPGVWAWVSARVLADSVISHYIGPNPTGTPVLTYYRTVYYKGNIKNSSAPPADGTPLKSGYIAIQAETHPWKFRKIEVLDLEGCMDKTLPAYRTYFVKSNPAACTGTATQKALEESLRKNITIHGGVAGFFFTAPSAGILEITDASGKTLTQIHVRAGMAQQVTIGQKGVCLVTWKTGATVSRIKWAGV